MLWRVCQTLGEEVADSTVPPAGPPADPGSEHRLLFKVRWSMSSIGIDRGSPDSLTGHVLVLPTHPNEEKILRTGIEPVTLG